MSKPYTIDETPASGDVIAGMIEFEVAEASLDTTQTGKVCAKMQYKAVEPEEVRGRIIFDTLTIGTEEDPLAEDPLTFGKKASISFKFLRDLFVETGMPRTGDLEVDVPALKGGRFLGSTKPEIQKDRDTKQPTGDVRSRVKKVFKVGSKPLFVQDVDAEGKVSSPRTSGSPSVAAVVATASATPPPPPPVPQSA